MAKTSPSHRMPCTSLNDIPTNVAAQNDILFCSLQNLWCPKYLGIEWNWWVPHLFLRTWTTLDTLPRWYRSPFFANSFGLYWPLTVQYHGAWNETAFFTGLILSHYFQPGIADPVTVPYCLTPPKINMTMAIPTMNEDVSPIKNGDVPARHVDFPGCSISHGMSSNLLIFVGSKIV